MFEYEVTADDIALAQVLAGAYCREQVNKGRELFIYRLLMIIVAALFGATVVSLFKKYAGTIIGYDLAWLIGLVISLMVLMAIYMKKYQKRFTARKESVLGPFPIQHKLRIDATGLVVDSKLGQTQYPWSTIHTLTALENHFMFTTGAASVVVIPFRAFSSTDDRKKFEAEMRANIKQP